MWCRKKSDGKRMEKEMVGRIERVVDKEKSERLEMKKVGCERDKRKLKKMKFGEIGF